MGHRAEPEHTHPDDVPVQAALAALADPVRLQLVRELAGVGDWERSCGTFDVPVGKAALSHHFAVLRGSGLLEQRDQGRGASTGCGARSSRPASRGCWRWSCARRAPKPDGHPLLWVTTLSTGWGLSTGASGIRRGGGS